MSDTPLLGLPLIEQAQAQKHVTHNEALLAIDALMQLAAISRSLDVPPAAPADGDRYLLSAAPEGAWAGQGGKLAYREAGAWRFASPRAGWRIWIADESRLLVFDGTAWSDVATGGVPSSVDLLGVNTSADMVNRLAVAAPGTLLTHEGGSHRLTVNKNASGDTGSLIFQTGYSGRAELGLAGDDAFRLKVSADGTAWTEALAVNAATGRVTLAPGSAGNAALADMPSATFKARSAAGLGPPEDLTAAQATALLNPFSAALKGLVPASGGGTANYLRADGIWTPPPAGSADPWTAVKLAADFSVNVTADTDVTGLSFTPAANKTYLVLGYFIVKTSVATTGPRPGLRWPTAGVVQNAARIEAPNSATASALRFAGSTAVANAASTGLADASNGWFAKCEAVLVTGAAPSGKLQATLASEVAGSAVNMLAGSFLLYREI